MRNHVWSTIARFNGSYAPRGSGGVVPSVDCTDDLPTQRIRRRFTIIARSHPAESVAELGLELAQRAFHRIIPVGVHRHIITAHVKIADVGQQNTHQPFRALQIKAPGIAAHARDRLVEHVEQLGRIHRFHQIIERFDVVSFGDVIRIPSDEHDLHRAARLAHGLRQRHAVHRAHFDVQQQNIDVTPPLIARQKPPCRREYVYLAPAAERPPMMRSASARTGRRHRCHRISQRESSS